MRLSDEQCKLYTRGLDKYVPDDLLDTIDALKLERDRAIAEALMSAAAICQCHGPCIEKGSHRSAHCNGCIYRSFIESLTPAAVRIQNEIRTWEVRKVEAEWWHVESMEPHEQHIYAECRRIAGYDAAISKLKAEIEDEENGR